MQKSQLVFEGTVDKMTMDGILGEPYHVPKYFTIPYVYPVNSRMYSARSLWTETDLMNVRIRSI